MAISEHQKQIILQELTDGESLVKAMQAADVASRKQVYELIESDQAFGDGYTRARALGYKSRADALLDTARDTTLDPARARILTDCMRWELSKMLPKLYGDKLVVETQRTDAESMTDAELAEAVAYLKQKRAEQGSK